MFNLEELQVSDRVVVRRITSYSDTLTEVEITEFSPTREYVKLKFFGWRKTSEIDWIEKLKPVSAW